MKLGDIVIFIQHDSEPMVSVGKKQVHVWIEGRVQGVFFRAYVKDAAIRFGLKGWVRNLRDGRVEAVFEGEGEKVQQMLDWCRCQGSPRSRVSRMEILEEGHTGEFDRFEIVA